MIKSCPSRLYIPKQKGDQHILSHMHGSFLPYLGRNYGLQMAAEENNGKGIARKDFFVLQKRKFVVITNCNNSSDIPASKIKSFYEQWLKEEASTFIPPRVEKYSSLIKIDPSGL